VDIEKHNREAWNRLVDGGDPWTTPVSPGQIEAGFAIAGLYEDRDPDNALSRYAPTFIATRARKG
jgi:hypothetical protein